MASLANKMLILAFAFTIGTFESWLHWSCRFLSRPSLTLAKSADGGQRARASDSNRWRSIALRESSWASNKKSLPAEGFANSLELGLSSLWPNASQETN